MNKIQETFNEQKVIYEWEKEFCRRAKGFLTALGCARIQGPKRNGNDPKLPHWWYMGWKKHGSKRHRSGIQFRGLDYSNGEVIKDTPIVYDLLDENRGWSQLYRPEAVGISENIDEGIILNEEISSEYTTNASFSITNRTKVSAKVEVGPASAEASNETEINASTSFGMTSGTRKKREYTHNIQTHIEVPATWLVKWYDEDDEKKQTFPSYAEAEQFSLKLINLNQSPELINRSKAVLVSTDILKRKVVTPIIENGFIEVELHFDLDDWVEEHKPYLKGGRDEKKNRIDFNSIQDLLWFIEGQRIVEYPNMRNFLRDQRKGDWWSAKETIKFYEWLKNKDNRHVQLAREQVRIYESAGEVKTVFVD